MPCPYCKSRKVTESETIATYDVRDEYIAIDRIICGKCGESYQKMIRQNLRTGTRKVICNGPRRDERPVRRGKRGILSFFRRQRR